jgi:queuine/archaeosine tRNA-ribosyltransferase
MNLIKQSREAIKKGKFKSFKDKIQRIYEKAERSVKKV